MELESLSCCTMVAGGILKLSGEKNHTVSHQMLFDGGNVVQFHLGVLETYSYLLCSCDAAMLIDPGRDISSYEKYMTDHHIRLCGVLLTHIPSDFVAGHIQAGEHFQVPVFAGKDARAAFQHIAISDDSSFSLGRLKLHFFSTPNHTQDGLSMTAGTDPEHPQMLFTGDALDTPTQVNAGMDWIKHLESMPDDIRIYTAHEIHGAENSWTTLREEKINNRLFNPMAQERKRHEYSRHAESVRRINRNGPPLIDWENAYTLTDPAKLPDSSRSRIIDIRNHSEYARKHIPDSFNIETNGRFEYWSSLLFDPQAGDIILTGNSSGELNEAAQRLHRVGFHIRGFLISDWFSAGLKTAGSHIIDAQELDTMLWSEEPPLVLDVRSEPEWKRARIAGSINIPLLELQEKMHTLPHGRMIVCVCASGFRSAIAAGILEKGGFGNIANLHGGIGAWLEEGKLLNSGIERNYTPEQSKCGIKA